MKSPDSHGYIAIALIALVFYVITLLAFFPSLQSSEIFKTLATAVVVSGLVGGVVAYYFSSSKKDTSDNSDGNK